MGYIRKVKYYIGMILVVAMLSGCVQSTTYLEIEDLPLDKDRLKEVQEQKKNNKEAEKEIELEYDESIVEYR